MKKLLACCLCIYLSGAVWAHTGYRTAAQTKQNSSQSAAADVFKTARKGDAATLRNMLVKADKSVLLYRDEYKNNILHVAKNKETFSLVWNALDEQTREELLAQKNNTGEIPMMTHIMFDHEAIFIEYFPRTALAAKMKAVTAGLKQPSRALRMAAYIQQEDILEQSNSGGQTMWQRAHAMYQGTFVDSYGRIHRKAMREVLELIEKTAPFLKR